MTIRAKKGGQIGRNGESYKGGQFLPNTNLPKRAALKHTGGYRMQVVEPGILEKGPEGYVSILVQLAGIYADQDEGKLIPRENLEVTANYRGIETSKIFQLITSYNNGWRWIESGNKFGIGKILPRNWRPE